MKEKNDSKNHVSGIAYSGGAMKLPGWQHPVIVDLQGLAIPGPIPLLMNHENTTASRLGLVDASIEGDMLGIGGDIVSGNEDARGIVSQGKAGADWQLSIGADVVRFRLEESTVCVNGRTFEAPVYVIAESVLREVSVVAVGADCETSLKVAARFHFPGIMPPETSTMNDTTFHFQTKEANMTQEKTNTNTESASAGNLAAVAAVAAERERIKAIHDICKDGYEDIEAQAIAGGEEPDKVAARVLAAIRAARPGAGLGITIKAKPEGDDMRRTLEAALSLRAGIEPEALVKTYGERAVEAGMADSRMSVKHLMEECLRLDGIECGRTFGNDTIRAAFSSVTLPGILGNVANKKLLQAFKAQPIVATKLCSSADLNDFKIHERYRMTDVGDLKPIAAGGEIQHGSLTEDRATNQLETYGKSFCLTREMIYNDDLGAFLKVPAAMGSRAARLIDQLFFARLLGNPTQSDGNRLFSAAHKNLLTGAASALSADSLKLAIKKFLDQVDADGQPINVEPKYLLVPTSLKFTAIELTKGTTFIMGGGDGNVVRPAMNAIADDNMGVVCSPYLSNAAYDGHSDTGWYLFGDTSVCSTFEIGYLRGRRTPTVERGETDFNTLGIWFRVYFDLGIREQDFRGMVKANGCA